MVIMPTLCANMTKDRPRYPCHDTPEALKSLRRSVLDELRLKWEKKLKDSGALEPEPAPAPPR